MPEGTGRCRDDRAHAPASERNRTPILDVLREILPERGSVLEIASGSGEHVCFFAREFPNLIFQPSDPDESARRSISSWISSSGLDNVRPPLPIRADDACWDLGDLPDQPAAILNINMIHISPWKACLGLMRSAGLLLPAGAALYLYGPYRRQDRPTAASNEEFDRGLRARNPAWGVRDLEAVVDCGREHALGLERIVEMPANNLSLIFRAGLVSAHPG